MSSEERDYSYFDPASLLPFTCELEPHDPNVQRLPSAYRGMDEAIYGAAGDKLF